GRVDLDNVDLFVEAFQQVEALRIGELWAIPAMLRLALIENIRRMTLRTLKRLEELARADRWVERVERGAGLEGEHLTRTLRTMLASQQRLTPTFVARFLSGLRQVSGASPALMGVERWLQHEELDPDDSLARATQRLVHTQLTMANSITSLRAIGQRDWRSFVERQSVMEAVLGTDPAGAYHRMTFATRDRYRHVVELLARQSGKAEDEVARRAVAMASEAPDD